MKHILVVVEREESVKPMLDKALKFAPESITVLYIVSNVLDSNAEALTTLINNEVKDACKSTILLEIVKSASEREEVLFKTLSSNKFDTTFLHRPQLGRELLDFSLIKAALKGPIKSSVLLCGDNRWRGQLKLLGTVDIFTRTPAQKELNDKVLTTSAQLANQLSADVSLLGVIPIPRIKQEFDITEPGEVMLKKGKLSKAKLEKIAEEMDVFTEYSVKIEAGSPHVLIPSVASKMKANLVVLGNVGRKGIKGLLIGNTAEKILTRLTVDVLIVRQ
ncbi:MULTISPECIES: universal stress protein [Alteromonadaceae]|uniref:universal stress protein n=1 Tax=Alteromonadaceae TaxID=72275 RepID=UPI001C0A6412|nr:MULTISPECIES: universal stress protein [Aliiglaciecola]MBU2876724.1 universal stress protein [Aliiglaciecola lipolytica]MDO6710316.1 universal stress protein [Aliiglaciecola sp. 2_MG-2023]MDO6751464.1 universal stress protein [Aliiglaciecola sp. 1_MG-2023]